MINSITLLGSSSGRNAGDAALIAGIMDSVDARLGRRIRYEIPTINPKYIRDQYHNDTVPIGMMPWHGSVKMFGIPTSRSIMRTDLTLIFDAILFDRALYNPLFNYMSSCWLMLPRAKRKGKKMAFMNVGGGPVKTNNGQKMLRDLSEIMDFMTARDAASYDIIRHELGVKNPRLLRTADSALNLVPCEKERAQEILRENGIDPEANILGINVNRYIDTWADKSNAESMGTDAFVDAYVKALDEVMPEIDAPVVFVATQHHDIDVSNAIINKLKRKDQAVLIANKYYNHYEIKGVLGELDLLFGMRLHANILGSSTLTPIVGLNYQPKVKFYFDDLGLSEYALPFDDFSAESVKELLLRGWANRADIRKTLETIIPVVKEKADSASRYVKILDEGGDLDQAFIDAGA